MMRRELIAGVALFGLVGGTASGSGDDRDDEHEPADAEVSIEVRHEGVPYDQYHLVSSLARVTVEVSEWNDDSEIVVERKGLTVDGHVYPDSYPGNETTTVPYGSEVRVWAPDSGETFAEGTVVLEGYEYIEEKEETGQMIAYVPEQLSAELSDTGDGADAEGSR